MNKVHCDKCGEDFQIQSREKKHGKGIKETYFVCPHCKERYSAFVTDAECREIQQKIRTIRSRLSKPAQELTSGKIDESEYRKRVNKIHTDIDKHKAILQDKMNKLKQKVSS